MAMNSSAKNKTGIPSLKIARSVMQEYKEGKSMTPPGSSTVNKIGCLLTKISQKYQKMTPVRRWQPRHKVTPVPINGGGGSAPQKLVPVPKNAVGGGGGKPRKLAPVRTFWHFFWSTPHFLARVSLFGHFLTGVIFWLFWLIFVTRHTIFCA